MFYLSSQITFGMQRIKGRKGLNEVFLQAQFLTLNSALYSHKRCYAVVLTTCTSCTPCAHLMCEIEISHELHRCRLLHLKQNDSFSAGLHTNMPALSSLIIYKNREKLGESLLNFSGFCFPDRLLISISLFSSPVHGWSPRTVMHSVSV